MKTYAVRINVEGIGLIDVDLAEDTYKKISSYCKKNYPDKEWKSSES